MSHPLLITLALSGYCVLLVVLSMLVGYELRRREQIYDQIKKLSEKSEDLSRLEDVWRFKLDDRRRNEWR